MTQPAAPAPASSGPVTVIRNADWAVVWNAEAGRHEYARGIDVVFQGDRIVSADGTWTGPADREIDGSARMAMPGFVDIHAHPSFETMLKGLTEEVYSPQFYMSSLYEFLFLFDIDPEGMRASSRVAIAELLQSGVTTLCDISAPHEGWLDILAETGIRAFAAPMFRSGRWLTRNGHAVEYEFDAKQGERKMAEALDAVDAARRHPSGRLDGVISPAQVDTCLAPLLTEAMAEAVSRDMPFTIHAAQGVVEFDEMMRRHGLSPIAWLESLGLLGRRTTIGHGIFLDHHPQLGRSERGDLDRLATSGTSVAHCPTVFVRRGISMRNFADYVKRGINMGIGTDTHPHNYVEEMRTAIYTSRTVSMDASAPTAEMVFHAATIGGAKALGRDDIGRIAPGAKADIVLVDVAHPSMRPLRDPLRGMIFSSGERAIKEVYVDGRQVVAEGRALAVDMEAAMAGVEAAQVRSMAGVAGHDWAGRSADAAMPLVLRARGHNAPGGPA